MLVGIRGLLEVVGPDWIHLRVAGLTFEILVPVTTVSALGPVGGEVHLFTQLRLREDQPVLYGFSSVVARDLFLLLTAVTGVGPRSALSLLSDLSVSELNNAIASGDVNTLSTARGLGKRTAGRIVLELKGKVEAMGSASLPRSADDDSEVISALVALGYSTNEVRRVVAGLDKSSDLTLEERIRRALQQFGSGR